MAIFKKKLLLLLFTLFAVVCLGLGLLFMPAVNSSADDVTVNEESQFDIQGSVLNGLTTATKNAIGNNNFSVVIPDGVTSIGAGAFSGSDKLTSVTIPGSVTSIGDRAFSRCSALTEVTIPGSVTTLGESAFFSCVGLVRVSMPESKITTIPAGLFQNCYKLEELNGKGINIPESVTVVADDAFSSCVAAKSITVPAKVGQIGSDAFYGLAGVTEINYFAKSATAVAAKPFAMLPRDYEISSVKVNIGDSTHEIDILPREMFSEHKSVREVKFTNVNLPDGEAGFGFNLFNDCTALTKVTFDESCNIIVINSNTFSGCTSLHTVEGLENIGLQTIGEKAFYMCRSLNTVTLGAEVSAIQNSAFLGCTRLIEVKNLSTTIELVAGDKEDQNHGCVAWYAKHVYGNGGESKIDRTDASGFVFYADVEGGNSEVLLIGYTGTGKTVSLPEKYTVGESGRTYKIYQSAFMGNTNMERLLIPATASVDEIGASAFEGCTALNEVELPKGLLSIGNNAFAGCTSLESVDFNANEALTELPTYLFKDCASLSSIVIPKSVTRIGAYSFSGCSKLTSVTFTGSVVNNVKKYALTTLGGYAFDRCTSLNAIEIPSSVNTIERGCFEGCSNLRFAYLPSKGTGTVSYGVDVFNNCHEDLVLISANKADYDKDKTYFTNFASNGHLTYLVKVDLVYHDGKDDDSHVINKLFGFGNLEQKELMWTEVSRMPVQTAHDGTLQYERSTWYTDDSYATKVTLADFSAMLSNEGVETLKLYAKYFDYPNLTANKTDAVYSDGKEYSINDILTEIFRYDGEVITGDKLSELTSNFRFDITSYTLVDGTDSGYSWSADEKIKNAGTYELTVSLPRDDRYGQWEDNLTVNFKINPQTVNIDEYVTWKPENGSLASDEVTRLYFYDENTTPYLDRIVIGENEDGSPKYREESSHKDVLSSYAVYSGKEIIIRLEWLASAYGEVIGSTYVNNRATLAGTYAAQVTVRPNNNYTFTYNPASDRLLELSQLGLKFSVQTDGTVIVSKTWYIAMSNANQLISSNEGGGLFSIDSEWTYMAGNIPSRPTLSQLSDRADELIKFSFEFTDLQGITNKFVSELYPDGKMPIRVYEHYMNNSMPAGQYKITFFISDGRDEDGNVVAGDPQGKSFNFTIKPVVITTTDTLEVSSKLNNKTFSFEYTGENVFASIDGIRLLDKPQAVKTGVWINYPQYYTPFAVVYRVVKDGIENSDTGYYTEEQYAKGGTDMVKPQSIGSYTVYYKFSAPNYGGEVAGSYKLNITHTLKPVLPTFEFQGGNVLSSVVNKLKSEVSDDLDYFEIFTMLDYSQLAENDLLFTGTRSASTALRNSYAYKGSINDEYSAVGTHNIFLRIKNEYSSFILWDSTLKVESFGNAERYLVLPVVIIATDNREKVALSVTEWEFGRFSESENKPVWVLMFGDDYANYEFTLQSKKDSSVEYYYYGDPAKEVAEGKSFNDAPVGAYLLIANAPGDPTKGYNEFTTSCEVSVHKVNIYFTKTPYLSGWTYGTLEGSTEITLNYTLGADIDEAVKEGITVRYCTVANYEAGRKNYIFNNLSSLANGEGYIPAGEYYAILTRAADANHEALEYTVRFSVLKAQNYWDSYPTIQSWTYGQFNSSMIPTEFNPHFGKDATIIVEFSKVNGDQRNWRPYEEILQNGQFAVGSYEMRVTMVLNSDEQRRNFTALDEVIVSFTVYEVGKAPTPVPGQTTPTPSGEADDGISDGLLIGLTVVFAVVAAAVVAGIVVFVVISKKKANSEYIKTVKSEMKRR